MHTTVKAVKQAIQQLQKAGSWVEPALEQLLEEGELEEDVLEAWRQAEVDVHEALTRYLED